MSETLTATASSLKRVLPTVDAWFYLAIGLLAIAIGVGIIIR